MLSLHLKKRLFTFILTSKINTQFLIWDAKSRWTIMKRNIGWENVISLFAHSNEKYDHFRDITLNCLVHCYLRGVVMVRCVKLVFFIHFEEKHGPGKSANSRFIYTWLPLLHVYAFPSFNSREIVQWELGIIQNIIDFFFQFRWMISQSTVLK